MGSLRPSRSSRLKSDTRWLISPTSEIPEACVCSSLLASLAASSARSSLVAAGRSAESSSSSYTAARGLSVLPL